MPTSASPAPPPPADGALPAAPAGGAAVGDARVDVGRGARSRVGGRPGSAAGGAGEPSLGLDGSAPASERARAILRLSHKDDDYLWARLTGRVPAAWLLALSARWPLTPNGLSVASLLLGLVACAGFVVLPGHAGLLAAWALLQLAYVVDCMDGMLARAAGLASPCGRALDFLADACKQVALFPAVAVRVWLEAGRPTEGLPAWPLVAAVLSGPLVASALMLTTFLRSPEVTGGPRPPRPAHGRSPAGRARAALSFLLNYPSWILLPVLLDRMDVFLLVSLPLYAVACAHGLLGVWRAACTGAHYGRPRG